MSNTLYFQAGLQGFDLEMLGMEDILRNDSLYEFYNAYMAFLKKKSTELELN